MIYPAPLLDISTVKVLFASFIVVAFAIIMGSSISIVGAILHFHEPRSISVTLPLFTTDDPIEKDASHFPPVLVIIGTVL